MSLSLSQLRAANSSLNNKPPEKAILRLETITADGILDESALDIECHIWETWIEIVNLMDDPDGLRKANYVSGQDISADFWNDLAEDYRKCRVHIARKILQQLGALSSTVSIEERDALSFLFKKSMKLETTIAELSHKLRLFRIIRPNSPDPTMWEIISQTFHDDLHHPRDPDAHHHGLEEEFQREQEARPATVSDLDTISDDESEVDVANKQYPPLPEAPEETKAATPENSPGDTATESRTRGQIKVDIAMAARRKRAVRVCPWPQCKAVVGGTGNLHRHFMAHMPEPGEFKCSRCEYRSTRGRTLRLHGAQEHGLGANHEDMIAMIASSSERLEGMLRAAQGLKGAFKPMTWA